MLFLRKHWQVSVVSLAVVLSVVLGYFGVNEYFNRLDDSRSLWDVGYYILCLFVLEVGELEGTVPWQLTTARLLGAGVAFWAVVRAALLLFDERLRAAKPGRWHGHAVVCGLGRKGLCLALELREKGINVAAIGREADHPNILRCRKEGVVTFLGDATDPEVLDRTGATRASHVFMVTGDDGANVEAAMKLYHMKKERQTEGASLKVFLHKTYLRLLSHMKYRQASTNNLTHCYVHVVDLHLCELFKQHSTFKDDTDQLDVRVFNTYENAARLLLARYPLEGYAMEDHNKRPHLILLGFGKMGQSIALQAVKIAHYPSGHPLRITVIDREACRRRALFYGGYPKFPDLCEAEFVDAEVSSDATITRLDAWATDPQVRVTLAVCLDKDSESLNAAMKMAARISGRGAQIHVRMFEDTGLAKLLEKNEGWLGCMHAFAGFAETCRVDEIVSERLDELARAIHQEYLGKHAHKYPEGKNPAFNTWEDLDPVRRNSNRQQADHIPVKLRAVGCAVAHKDAPGAPMRGFTTDEIETLAKMEHQRYCTERFLSGYTLGPRDDQKRTRPDLLPWEALTEARRETNRHTVRNIPQLLETVDEKMVRQ